MRAVTGGVFMLLAVGCGRRAEVPSPRRPADPPDMVTEADFVGACPDLGRFRRLAIRAARPADRAALAHWNPPAPVPDGDRPAVTAVVRRWVAMCAEHEIDELTARLVAFPTVASVEPPATGPAFQGMAAFLESWARDAGLSFRRIGANDAWEVLLGDGPRSVVFVTHADVVPAADAAQDGSGGWTLPPFEGTRRGGRLYGRGTEDDKGPIAVVLVVLRALARAGLVPRGQLVVAMGTSEEHDWSGMRRYAAQAPPAAFVISLDSSFPVVVSEAGFVAFQIASPIRPRRGRSKARIVEARGGEFLTQVPGEAHFVVEPATGETPADLFRRATAATSAESARGGGFRAEATLDGERVVIRTHGTAVHSSVADSGENALWPLATIAGRLDLEPGGAADVLRVVAEKMDGDHWGERLGLAYEHPDMGKLLVTPTMLRVEGGRAVLGINMRRPAGLTSAEFSARLDDALVALRRDVSPHLEEAGERSVFEPAITERGPLVDVLLDVYRANTGDRSAGPISIRGSTYSRLFPGSVSFGPRLPGHVKRAHAPDEYVESSTLSLYAKMVFDAVARLDRSAARPQPRR